MSFSLHHRFAVQPKTLDTVKSHCEPSEEYIFVGAKRCARPQRLHRWFLRGVPGNQCDLALLDGWDSESIMAVEIGQKEGKFGGTRWQIVVRHWYDRGQLLAPGHLIVSPDEDLETCVVAACWEAVLPAPTNRLTEPIAAGSWMHPFRRLQVELSDYDPKAILLWHWRNYYAVPLAVADLDGLIAEFVLTLAPDATLAGANRLASRILYRAARDAGWRKCTAREQERLRLSGQWHRTDAVAQRLADMGYVDGAGQYTHEAADGKAMTREEIDGYYQTSHGRVAVE